MHETNCNYLYVFSLRVTAMSGILRVFALLCVLAQTLGADPAVPADAVTNIEAEDESCGSDAPKDELSVVRVIRQISFPGQGAGES